MISSLVKNPDAYFSAFYYENAIDCEKNRNGRYFEFEEIQGDMVSASHAVRNILDSDGRRVIRTIWNMGFKLRTFVLIDSEKYIIESVATLRTESQASSNYLFKNASTAYELQLVRRDNVMGVSYQ